uniref:Uncharacterized protein n=1 Tax=Anguilla anguilla TaxID=7936 RepID=A0A0E9W8Z1_ANGAN
MEIQSWNLLDLYSSSSLPIRKLRISSTVIVFLLDVLTVVHRCFRLSFSAKGNHGYSGSSIVLQ